VASFGATIQNIAGQLQPNSVITTPETAHDADTIAAPGWAAVYVRDDREFVWPLVAWLRLPPGPGLLVAGLALSLDGRAVVRADEIEGFKCYLPPVEWLADPTTRG